MAFLRHSIVTSQFAQLFDGPSDCDVIMKSLRTGAMSGLGRSGNLILGIYVFYFTSDLVGFPALLPAPSENLALLTPPPSAMAI